MDTNSEQIITSHHGAVTMLELNRPSARNALSGALVEELRHKLSILDADDATHAVVLTGVAPGFCAGSDLKELADMSVAEMARHEANTGHVVRTIAQLRTPVIAAVEGFAIGGGFVLAAGCDVVVTAEDARWHLPEVSLGWVPPWGLAALVARVGVVSTRRLVWGEAPMTGAEMYQLGVVDVVAPPAAARERAMNVARMIAQLPPSAVSSTKRVLADLALNQAEALDARACWMFTLDCESERARDSLSKFSRKDKRDSK